MRGGTRRREGLLRLRVEMFPGKLWEIGLDKLLERSDCLYVVINRPQNLMSVNCQAALGAMSAKIIRRLIVLAMALQLLWFFILPPTTNRLAPRSPEMAQALRAWEANRTATTTAAMFEQLHRDDVRDLHRDEVVLGFMLLADVVAFYFFWNYGLR